MAICADLDGDGVRDILVGAPKASPGGRPFAGSIHAFSGSTGRWLHRHDGGREGQGLGSAIGSGFGAAAEGTPDVLIGDGAGGVLRISSAERTPSSFLGTDESWPVSAIAPLFHPSGEVSGVAIGVTGRWEGTGSVVLRWIPGERVHRLSGESDGSAFGCSLAASPAAKGGVGDLRLLVGAPGTSSGEKYGGGRVTLFGGPEFAKIAAIDGGPESESLGQRVVSVGDVDGDGIGDFAASAPGWGDSAGQHGAGRVVAVSGAKGVVLREIRGSSARERFGQGLAAAGDWDDDGRIDLAVGATGWGDSKGRVTVHSLVTGKTLASLEGEAMYCSFGFSLHGGVDIDGNGVPDVLVSSLRAWTATREPARRVEVFLNRSPTRAFLLEDPDAAPPGGK